MQKKCSISSISTKIAIISSLIIYIFGNIIAWSSPTMGVEVNIYTSTPIFYWFSLIWTYAFGILLTLKSLSISNKGNLCRIAGYTLLTLACISLVSLTTIRGYYLLNINSNDMAYHFACVSEILNDGTFGSNTNNPYPITHIAYSIYNLVSGSELRKIINIIPIFGTLLFLGGTYLLAKNIFRDGKELPFIFIFCSIVPFGSVSLISWRLASPIPTTYGYYLLPLLFCLIVIIMNHKNQIFLIPAAILIFFTTFIHPLILFVILSFIFAIYLTSSMQYIKSHNNKILNPITTKTLVLIFAAGISFFLWHFSSRYQIIGNILFSILHPSTINNINTASYVNYLSEGFSLGYNIFDILRMGGINLILLSIIIISLALYIFKKEYENKELRYLKIIFIFITFILVLTVILAVTPSSVHCSRYMCFLTMSGIICAGYLSCKFYHIIKERKYLFKIFLAVMLISLVILSICCYYPSPFTKSVMDHGTYEEITATSTLVPIINIKYDRDYINFELDAPATYLFGYGQYRYIKDGIYYTLSGGTDLIYGPKNNPEKESIVHFRYDRAMFYGNTIKKATYLLLWKKDRDYYQEYMPGMDQLRFTEADYNHIYTDKTVNHIYNSGEISTLLSMPT